MYQRKLFLTASSMKSEINTLDIAAFLQENDIQRELYLQPPRDSLVQKDVCGRERSVFMD